ncbi:uncharacterized protein [Prorops nasuta]|uniref:uncharacterized protein n=1 Tax=Prorops nasuta TaxID=863751 RepID=UPI0034CFB5E3
MMISEKIIDDIDWWLKNIITSKNQLREDKFLLEIYSDASLTGWGLFCNEKRSHGFWSSKESKEHINWLELKAAFYGLQCFAKALSYINRMGSIRYPKLSALAREIWQWCELRDLWIFASYICSKENKADDESRSIQTETEWELAEWAFDEISKKFGKFEIDLFASNINTKCNKFISWYRDPKAWTPETSATQDTFPGCREAIREAFRLKGAPDESIEVILASVTEGTLKQYNKPLFLWWKFCNSKQISVYRSPIAAILEYLTDCLKNIKSYGTLNSYRSALSMIMQEEIGQQPIIKRFFKGIAHLYPQAPKYEEIWDPKLVLNYLQSQWPNHLLSFEMLTKKLITLLALITAHRIQSFAKIRVGNIRISDSQVVIKIPDRIKTSGLGKQQPIWQIPFFKEQPKLRAATLLKEYLTQSKEKRPDGLSLPVA